MSISTEQQINTSNNMFFNLTITFRWIKYYCNDVWDEIGKPHEHLPLLNGGPWHVLCLTFIYLAFVCIIGPKFMQSRKPFQLKKLMFGHNVFLVIFNAVNFTVFFWATDFGEKLMHCVPFVYDLSSSKPVDFSRNIQIFCIYFFYLSKYIDFLDTVYMVLKKKPVGGLHLFHHCLMPISLYLIYKLIPYVNLCFAALVNSFVHVVMYAYYALAGLGPEYKQFLWWKKYITQLQLLQFLIIIAHGIYISTDYYCPVPVVFVDFSYGLVFFPLFLSYYRHSYRRDNIKPQPINNNNNHHHQSTPEQEEKKIIDSNGSYKRLK